MHGGVERYVSDDVDYALSAGGGVKRFLGVYFLYIFWRVYGSGGWV